MVNKLIMAAILLLIVPMVFALSITTTSLTINTIAEADVVIAVTNADNGNSVDNLDLKANSDGKVEAEIYSVSVDEINIHITVTKDFVQLVSEDYGPYATGGPVSIDAKQAVEEVTEPEPVQDVVEEDVANVEVAAEEKGADTGVTGKAVFGKEGIIKPTILWILGIVIVGGAVVFFGYRIVSQRMGGFKSPFRSSQNIIVRKQSDLLKEQEVMMKEAKHIGSKKLDQLEEKMKEIQSEIYKIKNEDKIREAEDKLKADMEKLERMRRGEE